MQTMIQTMRAVRTADAVNTVHTPHREISLTDSFLVVVHRVAKLDSRYVINVAEIILHGALGNEAEHDFKEADPHPNAKR